MIVKLLPIFNQSDDLLLHKKDFSLQYKQKTIDYFLENCKRIGLNIEYLKSVTKYLIFGTFHSLPSTISKKEVWNWLKSIQ